MVVGRLCSHTRGPGSYTKAFPGAIGVRRGHADGMTNTPDNSRFSDYRPAWVDKLADDVSLEGSILDGAVREKLAGTPYAEHYLAGE